MRKSAPASRTLLGLMTSYHMGFVDSDGRPVDGQRGKLLRPGLCLWACEAAGGERELALPAAAAVEWAHNSTLAHDDIQDGDRLRRHRETVWAIWGAAQGINAGDALLTLAFRELAAPGPHPSRRLQAAHALACAMVTVIDGQCLDLTMEGRLSTSTSAYLRVARAKTGALLGASLEMGAVMAGASLEAARGLADAGVLLGVVFQVRDDWLGTWGEPALTGKSHDGDLERRKITYPVVAGCAAMGEAERSRFRALFERRGGDAEDTASLRACLEAAGASEATEGICASFAAQAVAAATASGIPRDRIDQFKELTHRVANRIS